MPELTSVQAAEMWLPLHCIAMSDYEDDEDDEDAREIFSAPWEGRIIIAWPDGAVHIGVPPRTPEDIPAIYKCARILLEYCHERAHGAGTASSSESGNPGVH